jgi:UDP-N-acetylmuramoyl-L-alanyl-D-glutamate--2,6-diaminopimelate ligase
LLRHSEGALEIQSPLIGTYNVENVAGAAALALALEVGEEAIARAVRAMPQVPGSTRRES